MGKPAARAGDHHTCRKAAHVGGPIEEGSHNVFIGGLPAARLGDEVHCNGAVDIIAEGEPTVFINGRPAARLGDKTAHGGVITTGCHSVLIGTTVQARCAKQAAAAGSALVVSKDEAD